MKQLQHWFPDERVRLKRVQLRELILSFQKKLNPKLQYDPTKDIISWHDQIVATTNACNLWTLSVCMEVWSVFVYIVNKDRRKKNQ